jgi:uncharacterized RDD family membrane protein YckC
MAGHMASPPRSSAFYERKRRLAYYFAWASMVFLLLQLSIGFFLEVTSRPRAAASSEGFQVVHRALNQDEAEGSRLLILDPDGHPSAPSLTFPDAAGALIPEGRETTVFFGDHAARIADGRLLRSVDLKQKWDVLAAVDGPSGAWIFGWVDDHIVARRRIKDEWGPELDLAKSAEVEQIVASQEGSTGPLIAWRERGSTKVKIALFDGTAFVPKPEVDLGIVEYWDLVLSGGRRIVVYFNRDDRSYKYLTLRLECCKDCAAPLEPRKIRFSEPLLLLGRKVTGLSVVAARDQLRLFVTRVTTLMTGSVPLSTLEAEPATSRLVSISSQPLWRHLIAGFAPSMLGFCSLSMIFLGFVLFRERARLSGGIPVPGPPIADFFSRAMAFVLDLLLLSPAVYLTADLIIPESGIFDLEDPNFQLLELAWTGAYLVYFFIFEWRFGGTLGKKIIGLRVQHVDGSRLTLKGAILRTLGRLIDSMPLGMIGVTSILLTRRRQRLGDLVAKTIVVQDLPE